MACGNGLGPAERRKESLRDPPIDCSSHRRDAANLRHAFKRCQAVLVFRVVSPTAGDARNTCARSHRDLFFSPALNLSSLRLDRRPASTFAEELR